jgi:uncharacterized protein YprB with RNaseH-like and TPR domain
MLERTFCHLTGVSSRLESLLWEEGIRSWEEFLAAPESPLVSKRQAVAVAELRQSRESLECGDPLWFCRRLPAREQWRLFPAFRGSVAYLDIETTGLAPPRDRITTIALYDGREIRHYVQGENLHRFCHDIGRYRLLVTYNGRRFDVPFIERSLGIRLGQAHIDLMYILQGLGFRGGLKGCERQLGIARDELDGVDGYFAVLLWRDYLEGGGRASLETLLAYNIADVVNLEALFVKAYNLKLAETPFAAELELPLPTPPPAPFAADAATIGRLRRRHYGV